MLIVSYDFNNSKTRTKFSRFLLKYGVRLQYSVFEISNSNRIVELIINEIEHVYAPMFTQADSVLIFNVLNSSVIKYGYAIHREQPLVILG